MIPNMNKLCQTPPPISGYMPCSLSMHHKYSLPASFSGNISLLSNLIQLGRLPLFPISRVFRCNLVLTSRRLAGLELVQVPATDSQTTLVLVHALAEALDIVCARTRLRHLSRRRVSGLVLGGEFSVLRRGFGGGRGTASKPAADCVADGRSYCDTAVQSALVKCICVVCGPKFFFAMFLRMTTSWQWGWRDMGS